MFRLVGPILGAAILWIQYFDLKDALRKEPRRMLVLGFLLGALAAVLAYGSYGILSQFGYEGPGEGAAAQLGYFFGVVGPIEEGAKFAVAWAVLFRTRFFDEPIDGLVYSATVAIGFASLENALYAPHVSWPVHLARVATTPPSSRWTNPGWRVCWCWRSGRSSSEPRAGS